MAECTDKERELLDMIKDMHLSEIQSGLGYVHIHLEPMEVRDATGHHFAKTLFAVRG